jgi:hypothetical protein
VVEWVQIGDGDREGNYEQIALINIPHETLATRFGMTFSENVHRRRAGADGPRDHRADSGTQFLVQHEHDHPQLGVWLLGRVEVEPDKQRAEFADVLGLAPDDYRWVKRRDRSLDASTGGRI